MSKEPIVYSVVIPVYNSAPVLTLLHRRVVAVMESLRASFEVILVDDGSTDTSWSVLSGIARNDPRVVAIQLGQNIGQGQATLAGLRHTAGEILITLDDDLQHVPEEIPKLLAHLRGATGGATGYDVVFGVPTVRQHSLWRRLFSWSFNALFSPVLGKPLALRFSGFRAMSRPIAERLLALRWHNTYVSALLFQITPRIGSVRVKHSASQLTSSRYSVRKLLRVPFGFFGAFSDHDRRRFVFSAIGLGFILIAFVGGGLFIGQDSLLANTLIAAAATFGACALAFGLTAAVIGWRVTAFRRQVVAAAPIRRIICSRAVNVINDA